MSGKSFGQNPLCINYTKRLNKMSLFDLLDEFASRKIEPFQNMGFKVQHYLLWALEERNEVIKSIVDGGEDTCSEITDFLGIFAILGKVCFIGDREMKDLINFHFIYKAKSYKDNDNWSFPWCSKPLESEMRAYLSMINVNDRDWEVDVLFHISVLLLTEITDEIWRPYEDGKLEIVREGILANHVEDILRERLIHGDNRKYRLDIDDSKQNMKNEYLGGIEGEPLDSWKVRIET
jgi:hypothetical protein